MYTRSGNTAAQNSESVFTHSGAGTNRRPPHIDPPNLKQMIVDGVDSRRGALAQFRGLCDWTILPLAVPAYSGAFGGELGDMKHVPSLPPLVVKLHSS